MKRLQPKIECVDETRAALGESVCWWEADSAVLWVDIVGRKVLCSDPASGQTEAWAFAEQTGFVQPAEDGSWLVGQQRGILRFEPATGKTVWATALDDGRNDMRTNDAGCDRQGRLMVGTMLMPENGSEPAGSLYRFDGWRVETIDSGIYIPNGIAFSPEGDVAYWADSYRERRVVWHASCDPQTGQMGEKQVFVQFDETLGRPDGAAVDADGCYWVAATGGWQLLRYTPRGELDLAVALPVERPSKLAFGGADYRTIFVTSISHGLDPAALGEQPLAGRLIALDVGIQGLPPTLFHSTA